MVPIHSYGARLDESHKGNLNGKAGPALVCDLTTTIAGGSSRVRVRLDLVYDEIVTTM
jgi:hypothetical protein